MIHGKSEEDKIINKCQMPWNLLLSGMEWQDIAVMSNQKLSEMIGMKKQEKINNIEGGQGGPKPAPDPDHNPNPKPNPKPNPNPNPNPNPGLNPNAGAGLGPDLDPDSNPDNLPVVLKWSDKHPKAARIKPLAFVMDMIDEFINKTPILAKLFKRNERPNGMLYGRIRKERSDGEARESEIFTIDISTETDLNRVKGLLLQAASSVKGIESQISKLAQFPEIQAPLREMIEEDSKGIRLEGANLNTLQSMAAVLISQGTYKKDDMTKIMEEAAIREGVDPTTVGMKEPDKGYIKGVRDTVDKQIKYLLPRDIEEREEAWRLLDLYPEEKLEEIKEIAKNNQEKEDANVQGLKDRLELAKQKKEEFQARFDELQSGGKPSAPSLKDKRRALADSLKVKPYSEYDVAKGIGQTVKQALDEKDNGKIVQGDDEEQL